ncbi:uncharacterized protein LOC144563891 [Carex rostrata]
MEVIQRNWWIPLVPVSYYSAYKLTEIPPGHHQSGLIAPNQQQKIREEQFKTGRLLGEFLRLIRGKQPDVAGELQTSIVRYQEKSPNQLFNRKLQVDLVGIIHIGDEQYYQQIKNQLRSYDCVLFEGIEDVNSTDVEEVSACKKVINSHSEEANRIALVCQNNFIFEVQSWKKADLPWRTFAQLEEERLIRWKELENQGGRKIKRVLQIMPDILKHLLSDHSFWMPVPAFVPLITYLTCLRNGLNAHDIDKLEEMFKLGILHYFAKNPKFSRASDVVYEYDEDYEGDSNYTKFAVLIRERNKFAIEVLKAAIAEGKMSIAILFGAGHMADFHKRLVKELKMVPVTVEWGTA